MSSLDPSMSEQIASSPITARVADLLEQTAADNVCYIKLGRGNHWWPLALETNTIRLGFRQFDFQLCTKGDWQAAKADYARAKPDLDAGKVTSATNQVRKFFERPASTLWFTLADGDIWWCFAEPTVIDIFDGDIAKENETGARLRKVIDRWRNTDVNGKRLRQDTMTSKITKVISFQETICEPHGRADLLRIIRCQPSQEHGRALETLERLRQHVGDILDQLQFDEFELLVELIFSSSGWRRISSLGGNQKFFDLALILPTTGERCVVQVKSQTTPSILAEHIEQFRNYTGYSRMFFAYHTPTEPFANNDPERVTIWSRYEIAKQGIRAGLVEWVLERTT
jgi:hypothetical protein